MRSPRRRIYDDPRWAKLRAQVLREETHCYRCGHALDYQAPPRTTWSPSVDHVTPLALGGDPFDRHNLRAIHYGCNSAKRDRVLPTPNMSTSRRW